MLEITAFAHTILTSESSLHFDLLTFLTYACQGDTCNFFITTMTATRRHIFQSYTLSKFMLIHMDFAVLIE